MESTIIIEGVNLLKKAKRYKQVALINKLRRLGFELSGSSLSNILTDKKVGEDVLYNTAEGIQKIIKLELGLLWKDGEYVKDLDDLSWEPTIVAGLSAQTPSIIAKPGFAFYEEGRLSVQKKVEFFSSAQKEVIEFGITLNTFVSYFFSRNDLEFKTPVEKLLEKGVHFKCYLLDPDCNEARLYFSDRKKAVKEEVDNIEKIRSTIQKLSSLKKEFDEMNYEGSFDFYTYKHIPQNYFLVIDGTTSNGKMMVSHYIYGEHRAKCPVIEFSKNTSHSLYNRYWRSFKSFTQDAKKFM